MANFTTRVELHDASPSDYEALHERMLVEGFTRTITSDQDITYYLPTAEYNRQGDLTRDQVLDSAKAAAQRIGKQYAVLVTESSGRKWFGLQKVNPS